ncbi:bifunctional (p)ppGpp synthetase/guanosine-3',5'-bis(diphosphate) 3'-pyrophosphohydrolase [Desulfuromonas acetexigens]|uniref:Bifunctional (P)ppGpp synthetase/guanosine-3',5'-bis(Diphosphate) 3'-pyrophosphohydrolase n=2 Tax=Trichloromonas acetexigens TaxID=38815 RepID=A0A550JHW3_9BACT|nr:bifunctional (p)ppGpp synthetase/guanosine-3',5'-bis(diphosphate) 3'-pyrophosphohydrolase [Desulfuromonas acetexigens]
MELLVTHYGGGMSEAELDLSIDSLHRALRVAGDSHFGVFRKSGEPYFFHPLRVAHLAARHWMDFASVMAAILHDVVEDTPVTLGEIEADFGPEVALLVNGLTKAADDNVSREILKAETYRKQLLVAIEDVRVLCLKFWDRIDNLQTIGALKPEKQSLIAEETRSVYVPLASHLGMGYVASELDALSLKILYPRRATGYEQNLEELRRHMEAPLRKIRAEINKEFDHRKIPVLLRDRWRPFSIAAAKNMGRGFSTLYTLELQVDRTMDAYLALGLLHGLFHPIPGKLRDHLNVMSQFGYQALKTTVQAGEHRMRVEITTRKLARFNEAGVLAPGFEFRRANFEGLMRSLLEGESAFDTQSLRLASASIQVYTPLGDTRTLPEGSSALDLAFDIHEELGLRAMRARINGQTRPLKSRLMDGDQVGIEQSEFPQVMPKWLEWAVTPRARNAIRRYLRSRV